MEANFSKGFTRRRLQFISFTRNISFKRREGCRICFKVQEWLNVRENKSAAVDKKLHSE
jgi:hypothetical protein